MRVNEANEGPRATSGLWGGPQQGPRGPYLKGYLWVRAIISLGPADGDLLTEPTFSQGGVYTTIIQKECA